MKQYLVKQNLKLVLIAFAFLIGLGSLWYTNTLVSLLAREETKKIELWASAIKEMKTTPLTEDISPIIFQILLDNKTIPVIVVEDDGRISTTLNLDSTRIKNPKYIQRQLEAMKAEREPIEIQLPVGGSTQIYYKDSTILTQLFIFPVVQLGVVAFFLLIAYWAFSSSRNALQNQLWVGMSKETAHQLGTPISSLVAWVEILKMRNEDPIMVNEVEKDVQRLETITERFSKIGSTAALDSENINIVLENVLNYMKTRVSSGVAFVRNYNLNEITNVPLNIALFEWVIENLCKNAIDSMQGKGTITISVTNAAESVVIDVEDSGKGIPKSKFTTVFQPGFTTKKRGWGLGLSLAKRIIEINHKGEIFVKSSEINVGTVFRIILPKQKPTEIKYFARRLELSIKKLRNLDFD
ncbi:MAG TPA: ATP-binding protein [Bacteroidales bacterium]|nr:ATP-binding protein [Bacteroidales bacterium]